MKFSSTIIILIFLFLPGVLQAELEVHIEGARDSLLIGDPLNIRVNIEAPANGHLMYSDWEEILQPFELSARPKATVQSTEEGVQNVSIELLLSCYKTGAQVLQPIPFRWVSEDGEKADSAETEPIIIQVVGLVSDSILAMADTTQQPHHLLQENRRHRLGYSLAEILPWALTFLATIALFFLIRWLIKRRRKDSQELTAGPPPRPAYEIALEELDKLRDRRLYQAGQIKEYYVALSEIIRKYIEGRYEIAAMESTSFQLEREMQMRLSDKNLLSLLENLLSDADLAKFAKFLPDQIICQKDLERGYHFVEKTKPQPPPLFSEEAA